jgi:tetratricopeptide (TPR) repeat protein
MFSNGIIKNYYKRVQMTTSPKFEFNQPKDGDGDLNESNSQIANPVNLSIDPNYIKLLEHYQHSEFAKCKELLEILEDHHPGHPEILKFKDDLRMKLSLQNISTSTEKEEKQNKKKAILKMALFATVAIVVVVIAFIFSYNYFNDNVAEDQLQTEIVYLSSLEYQTDQLLLGGQPKPAIEIIDRIRTINPKFENLLELESRADALLQLEADYQTALNLIAENKNNDALALLKVIENEKPGMWDVSQQIDSIETSFQAAEYVEGGNAAYQGENWDKVISAYENALKLDSELDDPLMNEKLLKAYLNRILSMLESDDTSIEDIENAEEYYRKAVAMTSQSKAFASEREALQEASSTLLQLKFTQLAKANLEDKNQTMASINKAVSYLRKTVNIEPENADLILDLENAEIYQKGFKSFINMNWEQAVSFFDQIASEDSNYANGNANILLFNAYYQLGKQYDSLGLYLDAINKIEKAEILAWYDGGNLIKLFQLQVLLGDIFGKVNNFNSAVSYYQYALNAIQADERLKDFPALAEKLTQANAFMEKGNEEDAFKSFQEVLKDIYVIYSLSEVEIGDGVCLAFFANNNLSTLDAIIEANNLPKSMTITVGRNLIIPRIIE